MGASTPSGPTTAHSNGRAPSQKITAWLLADEEEWVRSEVQYAELSGLPPCSLEQLHAHYETYVRPGRLAFLLPTAEAEHAMNLPALRASLTEPVQTTCVLGSRCHTVLETQVHPVHLAALTSGSHRLSLLTWLSKCATRALSSLRRRHGLAFGATDHSLVTLR